MSYRERQRLADIQAAIEPIRSYLRRGDLSDGLVFDAVPIRLLEVGEAVKALPDDLLATQPAIPWRQIAKSGTIYLLDDLGARDIDMHLGQPTATFSGPATPVKSAAGAS